MCCTISVCWPRPVLWLRQGCHLQFRRILAGDGRSAAGQDRRHHRPEEQERIDGVGSRLLHVREANRIARGARPRTTVRVLAASSIHDDVHLGQDPDFGSGSPLNRRVDPIQETFSPPRFCPKPRASAVYFASHRILRTPAAAVASSTLAPPRPAMG